MIRRCTDKEIIQNLTDKAHILLSEKQGLEKELEETKGLAHLAINLIQHAQNMRDIQHKCFANEYPSVPDVGMDMPSYQTTALINKMRKIAGMEWDKDLCGQAINYLVAQSELKENGEEDE